jgi:hypothetical protein
VRRIARVFPRRTKATPIDDLAFYDVPGLFPPEVDEVHVSVTFTYDLPRAERLAREWRHVAPVKIGGPATGERGEEFVPGRYLKPGYVITSRGCPNCCWYCDVWRRDGRVRELPITDGWIVQDDNLLACSDGHIRAVFAMLAKQREAARFTGGLEAARLLPWHAEAMALRFDHLFFAYDDPSEYEPLRNAVDLMHRTGVKSGSHKLRCYVLIGHPRDTFEAAEKRLADCLQLGLFPMAMLYRDAQGLVDPEWRRFQRGWAAPAAVGARIKALREVDS